MLFNRLQTVHNTGNQRKSERLSAIALSPDPRRREQAVRQPGEVGHENGLRALLRSDPVDEPICGPHGPSSRRPANGNGDGAGRHAGDLAEQAATVQTAGAEPLRDGEHDLSVRHRREQCRVQPLGPDRSPLGMTARAEVPALAGERKQVLVHTRIAANTYEPVLQHASRHRGCVRHALSRTGERRAYARYGGGPSPFRCATGHSDATSVWRGLTALAAEARDS